MDDFTIEASSLSAITQLAFNPPDHAYGQLDAPLNSLTLYIARVPGRHDVFLTTMKPRDRIVSAQDVQSSLYYLHVNEPEDRALLHDYKLTSVDTDANHLPLRPQHTIKRKPMIPPRSPARSSPPRQQDHFPLKRKPVGQTANNTVARKPVLSEMVNMAVPQSPTSPDLRHPHPLPPIPTDLPYDESLHESNINLLRHVECRDDTNPYSMYCGPSMSDCLSTPGSLTVIRRDPGTGEQWNVAHIHESLGSTETIASRRSSFVSSSRTVGGPLSLDISNAGYEKFAEADICGSTSSLSSYSGDRPTNSTFRRQLQPSTSRDSFVPSDFTESSETLSERNAQRSPYSRPNAFRLSRPAKKGGYNFYSPWGGACEFSTGVTGKTLKCSHTLGHTTVEVSELRFNLPTLKLKAQEAEDKRSSRFLHRRQLSEQDDDVPTIVVDENGDIDLSLGQEFAGGGFGGRQAKLGKLIIHPQGLKMLDLVVAANMGLWWRAYQKT